MREVGIKDTVLEVIKYSKKLGLPYITKTQIINELAKTSLDKYNLRKYNPRERVSILDRQVSQALYRLHKQKLIIKKGRGRWTIKSKRPLYKPKLCTHLTTKDNFPYCPVRKAFISKLREFCEVRHGTKVSTMTKTIIPVCPGYFTGKSTPLSRQHSLNLIKQYENKKTVKTTVGGY